MYCFNLKRKKKRKMNVMIEVSLYLDYIAGKSISLMQSVYAI